MWMISFITFILTRQPTLPIKIITVEQNIEDWKPEGKIAELMCPNLKGFIQRVPSCILHKCLEYEETTMCGRFKTFNFIGEEHHIIHIEGQVEYLSMICNSSMNFISLGSFIQFHCSKILWNLFSRSNEGGRLARRQYLCI